MILQSKESEQSQVYDGLRRERGNWELDLASSLEKIQALGDLVPADENIIESFHDKVERFLKEIFEEIQQNVPDYFFQMDQRVERMLYLEKNAFPTFDSLRFDCDEANRVISESLNSNSKKSNESFLVV